MKSSPESVDVPNKALWLSEKKPWYFQSIRWYFRDKSLGLLDGAYFGLNGQDIMGIDDDGNVSGLAAQNQMIIASDAGIQRKSFLIVPVFFWSSLFCFVKGKWWTQMEHIEAQNEWFVEEVSYPSAASYIGQESVSQVIQEVLRRSDRREEFASLYGIPPDLLLNILSQPVYQIKKEGHEKVIICDLEIDRPDSGPVRMQYRV